MFTPLDLALHPSHSVKESVCVHPKGTVKFFPKFLKVFYVGAGGRVRKHDGTFVPEGVSLPPTTLKHIHRNIYSRSEVNNELKTTSWISELKRNLGFKIGNATPHFLHSFLTKLPSKIADTTNGFTRRTYKQAPSACTDSGLSFKAL